MAKRSFARVLRIVASVLTGAACGAAAELILRGVARVHIDRDIAPVVGLVLPPIVFGAVSFVVGLVTGGWLVSRTVVRGPSLTSYFLAGLIPNPFVYAAVVAYALDRPSREWMYDDCAVAILMLAFCYIAALVGVRQAIRGERGIYQEQGRCLSCGYDLTGNVSGVCPECGHTIWPRRR
jgi:hypothetical protein